MVRIALSILCLLFLSSCSTMKGLFNSGSGGGGVKISEVRGAPAGQLRKKIALKRGKFRSTLRNQNLLSKVRVVAIYKRGSNSNRLPEYRLFGIEDGSPYDMLGLENGDVLVAANDYVIFQPDKFKQYVYLLQEEEEAQIEIRRLGKSILFTYEFS